MEKQCFYSLSRSLIKTVKTILFWASTQRNYRITLANSLLHFIETINFPLQKAFNVAIIRFIWFCMPSNTWNFTSPFQSQLACSPPRFLTSNMQPSITEIISLNFSNFSAVSCFESFVIAPHKLAGNKRAFVNDLSNNMCNLLHLIYIM